MPSGRKNTAVCRRVLHSAKGTRMGTRQQWLTLLSSFSQVLGKDDGESLLSLEEWELEELSSRTKQSARR